MFGSRSCRARILGVRIRSLPSDEVSVGFGKQSLDGVIVRLKVFALAICVQQDASSWVDADGHESCFASHDFFLFVTSVSFHGSNGKVYIFKPF